jgi:hypothetical protein
MPKATIAEIEKKIRENEQKIAKLNEKKASAEAKAKECAERAEAAARAGDVAAYRAATEEKEEAQALAYVSGVQVKECSAKITDTEALEAWENYRQEYEAKLEKKKAELEKIRGSFASVFEAIVNDQNEAFKQREKVAAWLDIMPSLYESGDTAFRALPLATLGTNWLEYNMLSFSNDAEFYALYKGITSHSQEYAKLIRVLKHHRAYTES